MIFRWRLGWALLYTIVTRLGAKGMRSGPNGGHLFLGIDSIIDIRRTFLRVLICILVRRDSHVCFCIFVPNAFPPFLLLGQSSQQMKWCGKAMPFGMLLNAYITLVNHTHPR